MPVKAPPPPAVVATGGFFWSLTGSYFLDDPNKDIFISPNNGGGGGVNCCGSGLGDGWGTRGSIGYRWSSWDIAVAFEYAKMNRGDLNPSYSGSTLLHAPNGKYFVVDGEIGFTTMLGVAKARVFAGPRYVQWKMHDADQQTLPQFTFDVETSAIGPRVGVALSGPFTANIGWMAEGSVAWLFGDVEGTTGGLAAVQTLKVNRTINNAEVRAGLEILMASTGKFTLGYQAIFWKGALPEFEYNGFSAPLVGGRAETINHGPFARFSYGM